MVDADDPDAYDRGKAVYREIARYAVEQGGTVTGEHGIGIGKRDLLGEEHTDGTVDLMRRVKETFDPQGILNPGKVFPEDD